MSAFQQKTRSLGVRAGILAGASAAVLAVFGIGAGSAMAAPTCPGGTIAGQGSSLQKIAQQSVWNSKYNTACGAGSVTTYNPSGSGAGLKAMGYQGGSIDTTGTQYGGTDEAPEKTQIEAAEALAGGNAVIVPVSQTAIAVVVHPPSGCSFKSETGISWAELNKIFGGTAFTNWNQLGNVTGTCTHAITRVVRKDGSGTTYQFKNYLATLEETTGIKAETLPCETAGASTWAGLRKNNGKTKAEGNPNLNWPECGTHSTVVAVEGGGVVAETVAAATGEGDIGYAALPDAKGHSAAFAMLQNGKTGAVARYATPENASTKTARCENQRYTIPSTASTGVNVDWSASFGATPNITTSEYPLCTLTFDLGFEKAHTAGYTEAQAKEVADYIKYEVAKEEGQKDLVGNYYSVLPANVQEAAITAANKLG
jgi:ABC-type phosphate transport system substrate-binding protein